VSASRRNRYSGMRYLAAEAVAFRLFKTGVNR
jgi:hypothetical protein